ncbi:hypothetical protein CC86DRAFT_426444 [Ophiobolus disseminans]|uniref:Uncharacterized protein n=1 Tax=Ophiobolus disseminans TaxID=1469910 RepID=A0A6A6ZLW8_9PLEO|nr:hypothetical protein CC86DRAFT_426444 [Ophiobolus disseminans]
MAQPLPPNIPPELVPKWRALRHQHQQQIDDFQHTVTADRKEFERRVEASKESLLARHLAEESQLWSKHNGKASTNAKSAASTNSPAANRTPGRVRTAATPAANPSTPKGRQAQRTPATPTKASQSSRIPPAPSKPRDHSRQAPVAVIDLCSDDEDDLPLARRRGVQRSAAKETTAQNSTPQVLAEEDSDDCMIVDQPSPVAQNNNAAFSIPTASLSLFGGFAKNQTPTPNLFTVKSENQRGTPEPSNLFFASSAPSTEKEFNGLPSPMPAPAPSYLSRASTAAPQLGKPSASSRLTPMPSSYVFATLNGVGLGTPLSPHHERASPFYQSDRGFSIRPEDVQQRASSAIPGASRFSPPVTKSLVSDKRPEIPLSSLRQQQHDRSAILQEPTVLPQNQTLFALEQQKQNGGFVNNVIRNERGQSLTPALSKVLGSNDGGGDDDMEMEDASSPFQDVTPPNKGQAPKSPGSARALPAKTQQQHLPTPPPSHVSFVSEPTSFKKPSVPASATPAGTRHIHAGTADFRASSLTLQAATQHGQRSHSITSVRTVGTESRKRPQEFELSDGEDSQDDYEPSEPDSPSVEKSARKATKTKEVPVTKKSRALDGTAISKPQPRVERVKGKNGFGFKYAPTQTPKTPTSASWREPTSLMFSSPAVSSPKSPSIRVPAPKLKAPAAKKGGKKFIPQPGKRRAAVAAEGRIHGYFEAAAEFNTECAIEDDVEEARLPDEMRRLSMTPSPPNSQLAAEFGEVSTNSEDGESEPTESVDMLVNPELTSASSNKAGVKDNAYNWTAGTHTRAGGDRNATKYQATVADVDDDSDLDISEYTFVNGVIVRKDQIGELGLMLATQTMTSRAIKAGRPGREKLRVAASRSLGYWARLRGEGGCSMS